MARPMPAGDLPQWLKSHQARLHELRAAPPRSANED